MSTRGEYVAFRPRRRAFASRRKPLLSLGSWVMALAGAIFGGVVTAGWLEPEVREQMPSPTALLTPPIPALSPGRPTNSANEAATVLPARAVADTKYFDTQGDARGAEAVSPLKAEQEFEEAPAGTHKLSGRASRIVDGDTFYLEGVQARLRIWGIDAPEKNEPGAAEATEALTSLIAGKALSCEELDRDRYARIVARCMLDDGSDIGREMIDIGAATELTRYSNGYYGG